jgi:hypothetical protein
VLFPSPLPPRERLTIVLQLSHHQQFLSSNLMTYSTCSAVLFAKDDHSNPVADAHHDAVKRSMTTFRVSPQLQSEIILELLVLSSRPDEPRRTFAGYDVLGCGSAHKMIPINSGLSHSNASSFAITQERPESSTGMHYCALKSHQY